MLALVTCHIFPPSIWYGKKWIPVTWLPWESARIFSDATASQMHSPAMRNPAFTSKSAMSQIRGEPHDFLKLLPLHASKNILHHNLHYPSSWLKMVQDYLCHYVNLVTTDRNSGKCATLLHGQMYLQEKTPVLQFGHTLEQNSSICPSISYLWMVDLVMRFFSCGASLWRSSARIRPKKGPAPWILFLTPAPRPLQVTFLVGEAEHVCLYPFARTTVFSAKKTCVLQFGRALTQNSWIRPIMSYQWMIGLVTRLFSCGPTCEIIRKYSVKKGPAPWIWFLTPAPLPLEVTFLVGEGEHMWLYPFCKVI